MAYSTLRPLLFRLDAERAHGLALRALSAMPQRAISSKGGPLATSVAGVHFSNPVGMAAGFDKDAVAAKGLLRLGFGSVEVGTLTPRAQPGNPRPRLFRLVEDRAVINRMGFNNGGVDAAANRLARRDRSAGVVGINIGANKDSVDRIADYRDAFRRVAPLADYVTINISSPNTPGLRALQDKGALEGLLDAVLAERSAPGCQVPIFLKVAPDLEMADIDDIAGVALDRRLDALIVSNTTVARPPLRSVHAGEAGGLSGAPLKGPALQRLRDFRKATGGGIPLIGVGGIATAEDAWQRILAGASLVQLYSAMVYEGPGIARHICKGLERLMRRDGFGSIAEAVGCE
ncbi:dihydroorotate dehydrogenase [Novosphingobium chloroacetimidivorans]|uniref:Dihydroorotate dehydrogenase (quinone) n=1 Tax=Novosphingobium chloroacetimidivorans TaxID=1428314 RepID=A0A7W7NW40_9SPHN|nr:quinone-dependent dihydroorotate dehydrogenase [Novosphingobium chloroacetimidivorans]MBB4858019.1 dihydroorotate dehydrogenase [Novosphingobium chloroacetimidivorans]